MAHELEVFDNGAAAFVAARTPGWHRLGTVAEDWLTAEQALSAAYLADWHVRKTPLSTVVAGADGTPHTLPVDDRYATVRDHPTTGQPQVLGVVGRDYQPYQNEDCCQLLNTLVDESGAHFDTAGSLYGGRQVFVTMKMPDAVRVGGTDRLDLYLAATTSHDGTTSLRVDFTPVRIVCANTQRAALRASRAHYCFRHTSGLSRNITQARQALGMSWRYFADFEREADKMIQETLTLGEFEKLCDQIWPPEPDPSPRTRTNHAKRTSMLRYLLTDADTQAAIRGTRWAGYQAITEYLDWGVPATDDTVRATRQVSTTNTAASIKRRAFDLLTV